MYIGSHQTWNEDKYPHIWKGKWDEILPQNPDTYLVQMHPVLKRCGENMHSDASDASMKMMMDVKDFSIFSEIAFILKRWMRTTLKVEKMTDQQVPQVDTSFEEFNSEAKFDQSKKEVFSTKEQPWGIDLGKCTDRRSSKLTSDHGKRYRRSDGKSKQRDIRKLSGSCSKECRIDS